MQYRFEFRPYRRRFKHPLQTSHGIWEVREGIILSLSDKTGQTSWGEIAPLSWFGSETLEQALDFCRQLPIEITDKTIFSIPITLPACQFGFESAWEALSYDNDLGNCGNRQVAKGIGTVTYSTLAYSSLLPSGEAALHQWQILWKQGYRTFKLKIGVAPIQEELKVFHQLIQALPKSARLRLDANGGLDVESASVWLQACDPVCVEFLEQPLPVEQFDAMLKLSTQYSTQLALDESVASFKQLQAVYQQGWRGVFVIKPCIAGSPSRLRQFCREHDIDAVFSSVFETALGRHAALRLANENNCHNRAVGFGISYWFDEEDNEICC